MKSNRFSFFAPAYLEKSTSTAGPTLTNPVKVGGVITTPDKDTDGERISKSSDFSYFTGGFGKIKFEHKEYKEPYSIIGFPTQLIQKGQDTHFKGELIPFDPSLEKQPTVQKELAKAAFDLLREIEDHNKRHPNNLQKAGWSIEGEYLSKDKNTGLVKARIINVVLTTKPRNMKTYAEIIKSLEVGYGMSPDTQTGLGALRKESLDGNNKNQSQGVKKMVFKNANDVYKSALAEGKSEDEARKLADQFMQDKTSKTEEDYSNAEKSIGSAKEKLEKSIELANGIADNNIEFEVDTLTSKLNKSIQFDEDEGIQIEKFFKAQNGIVIKSLEAIESINNKVNDLAKSVALVAEAQKEMGTSDSFVKDIATVTSEEIQSLRNNLVGFMGMVKKSLNVNVHPANLDSYNIDDQGGSTEPNIKMTKSLTIEALEALKEEGKVSEDQISMYDTSGYIDAPVKKLAVQKAVELKKQ